MYLSGCGTCQCILHQEAGRFLRWLRKRAVWIGRPCATQRLVLMNKVCSLQTFMLQLLIPRGKDFVKWAGFSDKMLDSACVSSAGVSRAPHDLLIIDEGQSLYHLSRQADDLWNALKALSGGPQFGVVPRRLRVIMAVMYGTEPSGLPVEQRQSDQPIRQHGAPLTPRTSGRGTSVAEPMMVDSGSRTSSEAGYSPMDFGVNYMLTVERREFELSRGVWVKLGLALSLSEYDDLLLSFRTVIQRPDAMTACDTKNAVYSLTSGQVGSLYTVFSLRLHKMTPRNFYLRYAFAARLDCQAAGYVGCKASEPSSGWRRGHC